MPLGDRSPRGLFSDIFGGDGCGDHVLLYNNGAFVNINLATQLFDRERGFLDVVLRIWMGVDVLSRACGAW